MATPYNPLAGIYGVKPPPKKKQTFTTANPNNLAGTGAGLSAPWQSGNLGMGGYNPGNDNWFSVDTDMGLDPNAPEWQVDPSWGGIGPAPGVGGNTPTRKGSISVMGVPDYRGILDQYTADWRGRLNTGRANMETQRLGNARGLINRLGVRDPNAMFAKLGKFGITMEDLQGAADNPWSNLKAIDQQAREGRSQGFASRAARGGARSGGSSRLAEKVEDQRSRMESQANEEALLGLAEGQGNVQNWYQSQEDQMMQRTFDLEQSLSQRYQPQVANWDDSQGGYRWGNEVYDANGTLIKRL